MSLLISFLLCNLSKMSNRGKGGKRGAATFSKKDCEFTVELNQLMQPIGRNSKDFTSWLGVKLKAGFPYHIPSGLTPFETYKNLDSKHWKEFVTQRSRKEFEVVFERKMIDDGSYFSNKEDPLTRLLGPKHGGRSRTVSNIIGRTQVQEGLFQGGRQQHQDNMPTNQTRSYSGLDSSPNSCGENDTSGGCHIQYPLIEEPTLCELLHPSPSKREQIVGTTYLHPSPSRTIHTGPMAEGYVKIQVWLLSLVKLSRSTEATSQNPALTQPAQDNSCYQPEVRILVWCWLEVPIEQDQSHECYQIDATMIECFGDEFLFGAHDVSTQHDVDGSEEELDEMVFKN
ncbi:hypothetical protein Hanom_Chr02g00111381 [Helianthus anomalus]